VAHLVVVMPCAVFLSFATLHPATFAQCGADRDRPCPYSFRALWRHYRTCRRNKRATKNALAFEIDAEAGLLALQAELRARTYRPGPSICFLSGGPKPREVFAAGFRDRIVHHLLVAHQERVFEPRFIHDSFACRRGIEFVGWKTWWDRRLARRRTVGNLSMRIDAFARAAVRPVYQGAARRIALGTPRAAARVERLRATLASYSGHLRHGAAFGDWDRAWRRHRWLGALFARRGWQVAARWPPRPLARAGRFSDQYWQLVRRAGPRCLVFCQVGCYVEFRGPQRCTAERVLGLATTHFARAGYGLAVGFPGWIARRYEARALARGHAVAVVRETGERPAGCYGRRPVALLVPEAGCAVIGRAPT
jgi:hypothetical protein